MKLWITFFFIVLFFFVFSLRLIQYQVVDKPIIDKQAESQLVRKIPYKAMRGEILDRNGSVLAFSRDTYDIEVVHEPKELRKDVLDSIIEVYPDADFQDMSKRMLESEQMYVRVLEDLPLEIAEAIGEVDFRNIGVIKRFKRVYPNGELASIVLGTLDVDGNGLSGIEERFDADLKGTDGFIETKTDLFGRRNPYSEVNEVAPSHGKTIVLTLDAAIQHFAQSIVDEETSILGAKDILAIVQDAKSAEILAMASSAHGFDPNNPRSISNPELLKEYETAKTDEERSLVLFKMWKNPFVSMFYEPGSTMKIFVALSSLEENLVSSDTPFLCGGVTSVDGEPVRCVTFPGSHGNITFKEGFMYSCNVVFTEVGMTLGIDKFYNNLENMGLLAKMDIGLPMDYNPVYIPKDEIYDVDFAKMTFGHSISLTPLHVANLAHTVSNDGDLTFPTLIKKVGDKPWKRKNVGRIFSKETTALVKEYMEATSDMNPADLGVSGYRVGAKTGTSEKFVDGEYNSDYVTTSVVQISPINDPQINVIVIVDEPGENIHSAPTAGKVAGRLSAECLRYLKIAPNKEHKPSFVKVPDFIGMTKSEALIQAENFGINLLEDDDKFEDIENTELIVTAQIPSAGNLISSEKKVKLIYEKKSKE